MPAVVYDFFAGPLSNVTRTNLVPNPSFETNTAGWVVASLSLLRVTTDSFVGSACMQMTSTSNVALDARTAYDPNSLVIAGQAYTASAYLKNTAGNNRNHTIQLRWFNSGGGLISTISTTIAINVGSPWTRVSVTGTAPVGAYNADIAILTQATNPSVSNVSLVDAVLFEQSLTLLPYFDGSFAAPYIDHTLLSQAWNGTVNNSTSTATWRNNIPAVQNKDTSFTVTKGRQQVQDPFRASTATVTGLDISQVSGLNIGDTFIIRTKTINGSAVVFDVFNGFIADVTVNYGFNTNGDTWTIQAEDAIALAGRTTTNQSWTAGDTTYTAATKAAIGSGVDVGDGGFTATSTVSAQTLNNANLLNVINQLAATEQARLWATGNQIIFQSRSGQGSGGNLINFSDGTLTVLGPVNYDLITFRSRADSYYTRVITEPAGLAAQTEGTGTRTFTMATYDETTSQADNLASYVLGTLEVSQDVPSTLSFLMEQVGNANAMFLAIFGNAGVYTATVVLRGVQYNLLVEGSTITANPAQTRCTLNLSSPDAASSFILDNAVLGVLNTSKLGF